VGKSCNNNFIILLAEKPAKGGLLCYGAPSTAAIRRRSDDCDSTTDLIVPLLLAKFSVLLAFGSLLAI